MPPINHRLATLTDIPLLAEMNRQLAEDERHRNRFRDIQWLQQRTGTFLTGEYRAVLFERDDQPVAYALFRPDGDDRIYFRQIL